MKLFIIALLFCSNAFASGWDTTTATDKMTGVQEKYALAKSEPVMLATGATAAAFRVFKAESQFVVVGASVACFLKCDIRVAFNDTNVQSFTAEPISGTGGIAFLIREESKFKSNLQGPSRLKLEVPILGQTPVIFEFNMPSSLQSF